MTKGDENCSTCNGSGYFDNCFDQRFTCKCVDEKKKKEKKMKYEDIKRLEVAFDNMDKGEDEVNSPTHYNQHGIECIQAIQASMSEEEFKGYLKGNQIKYIWRYRYKGKEKQDLEKAQWYLQRLIEVTDG